MKKQKSTLKPKSSTLNMRIASKASTTTRLQKTEIPNASEERLIPLKSQATLLNVLANTPSLTPLSSSHQASKQPSGQIRREHHYHGHSHHHLHSATGQILKQSLIDKNHKHEKTVIQETHLATIEQLKKQLEDKQNIIKFVQESHKTAIAELQQTIAELKKQNSELRSVEKPVDRSQALNQMELHKMETSSLKCDVAATRSELFMCHKTIEKLERELIEIRAREKLFLKTQGIQGSASRRKLSMPIVAQTRAFGTEITSKCLELKNHSKGIPERKEFSCSESAIGARESQGSVSFELSESSSAFDSRIK